MRIGKKIDNKEYYKRPSVYAIIEREEDNKIAIVSDNPDVYFFLGGGIEKDEIEVDALKREIIEESGYSLSDIKIFDKICSYCYSDTNGYMDIDAAIYIAKFNTKVAEPIEKDHKLMWVDPNEYKDKLFHEYQRYILNKYAEQKSKRFVYSSTTRSLGEKNNIINFKKGLEELKKSKFNNANFNFFEIQELLDNDNYKKIFGEIIKGCNLKFNIAHAPIHFPFFFNKYYNLDKKNLYEQRIVRAINLSSKLNAEWIVIHLGTVLGIDGRYDLKQSIEENIKYLSKFVELANKNNIKIAIENGTNMEEEVTPTIDELISIVDYYNNYYNKEVLGICFDFGHANVGKLDIYNEIKKIGNRLKVTHIHDNYGTDTHNFPFNGNIDWKRVIAALNEIYYTGELTLEVRYEDNKFNCDKINETYLLLEKIETSKINFVNYAHRGASQYYPENTLISFKKGIELGATGIELDLQKTKDNKIVIFHDDIIDNKSNGKGKISDYTYNELLELDFGSWFNSKFKNVKIMLFEDFAKEFLNKNLTFAIELKVAGIEQEVLEIIKKYQTHNNLYISSFKYEALENMRKLDKEIKLSWLIQERITQNNINKLLKINGSQICPPADLIYKEDISLALKNGLNVRLWGVKNIELMMKVYKLNIEGMTVNFPDKLYELLNIE